MEGNAVVGDIGDGVVVSLEAVGTKVNIGYSQETPLQMSQNTLLYPFLSLINLHVIYI